MESMLNRRPSSSRSTVRRPSATKSPFRARAAGSPTSLYDAILESEASAISVRLAFGICHSAFGAALRVAAGDHPSAAVAVDDVLAEALAEEHLGLAIVRDVRDEPDDVEIELRERRAHLVELVLRLHEDLVEAVRQRPDFLLLGQRPEVPLPPPVASRAADPLI